jgi:Leucine-rich repeat (LRR) protein
MKIKSLTELLKCSDYESVSEIVITDDTVNDDIFQLIYKCINVKKIKTFETYTNNVPNGIKVLQNLEILIITYNIHITNITEELYELINLKYLDISNNGLKTLSPNINKLVNLKYLNISNNEIFNIPKEIGDLVLLQQLYIYMDTALDLDRSDWYLHDKETITYLPNELCKLKMCIINYDSCRINKKTILYDDCMIIFNTFLNFHLNTNDEIFNIPDNIIVLTTYDNNINFNNLPCCLEYLTIHSATGNKLSNNKLYNLPTTLKSLIIYKNIPSEKINESDINLPFGCKLLII